MSSHKPPSNSAENINTNGGAYVDGDISTSGGDVVARDRVVHGDEVRGDKITTGSIEGVGIAIGTGASVTIYGDIHYYPIKLRAPLRRVFDPLIEDHTQHFAGRSADLARIGDFIKDPAGGYLVITAPAGFGKTALMAVLVSRTPEAFAYHFFTPLYGLESLSETRFLANVVEQMAQWHGYTEELPEQLLQLQALYQQFVVEPLDHTRVLILDGLDEVTSWKLAPYLSRHLPAGLHLILTVRDVGQDWKDEYHLPRAQTYHLPLDGLGRHDVGAVIRTTGELALASATNPEARKAARLAIALADDDKALDNVVAIAAYQADPMLGSDPFYVRILAEDLASGVIAPDQVRKQPPGLDNYLKQWWEQFRKTTNRKPIADLLSTLAVTLGPIARSDLETLNPSLVHKVRRNYFDEVVQQVRRWVVTIPEGHALAHPRLRHYLPKELRTESHYEKLVNYCRRWREHRSEYALRYYAQHLAEAGQIDELYRLLSEETLEHHSAWYEAKEASGQVVGYLADIAAAWRSAQAVFTSAFLNSSDGIPPGTPIDFALQCHCALITASFYSLATNMLPSLLAALIVKRVWTPTQGLLYTRLMPDPKRRAEALALLAPHLSETQQSEALREAQAIADIEARARAMVALVPHLPRRLRDAAVRQALDAVGEVQVPAAWSDLLAQLAPHLPEPLLGKVLSQVQEIRYLAIVLVQLINNTSPSIVCAFLAEHRTYTGGY